VRRFRGGKDFRPGNEALTTVVSIQNWTGKPAVQAGDNGQFPSVVLKRHH
jgi:hypothetical protein